MSENGEHNFVTRRIFFLYEWRATQMTDYVENVIAPRSEMAQTCEIGILNPTQYISLFAACTIICFLVIIYSEIKIW